MLRLLVYLEQEHVKKSTTKKKKKVQVAGALWNFHNKVVFIIKPNIFWQGKIRFPNQINRNP